MGGGRSLEKGTCSYHDVIMASELKATGSCGFGAPGLKSSTGPLVEYSLLTTSIVRGLSIEIVMHHGCALNFPIETIHAGTLREHFCLGTVKLNLIEST